MAFDLVLQPFLGAGLTGNSELGVSEALLWCQGWNWGAVLDWGRGTTV